MSRRVFLCKEAELPSNSPHRVCPSGGGAYLLYKVEGAIFMTDDLCTHGRVSMATGTVNGHRIECPLHGGAFDIRTGLATEFPCKQPIATHRVELVGESVFGWLE